MPNDAGEASSVFDIVDLPLVALWLLGPSTCGLIDGLRDGVWPLRQFGEDDVDLGPDTGLDLAADQGPFAQHIEWVCFGVQF